MALHLPILGRCNIRCVFCSAWGRGGDFDLEKLKGEIDRDATGHVQVSGDRSASRGRDSCRRA